MKVGVVVFPGSNCDHDADYTFGTLLGHETTLLWHKDTDLQGVDLVILPGGFSYGDYLRSGAIARFSPIMNEVANHAKSGGAVVGICNGFQVLCEAGLLPGALARNTNRLFQCQNVYLLPEQNGPLVQAGLDVSPLRVPIAHGEGRYFAPAEMLERIEGQGQVLLRYCDSLGNIGDEANPNGSLNHIAGVCNEGRNIMGLMPHPERASDPLLGNTDGRGILEAMARIAMGLAQAA